MDSILLIDGAVESLVYSSELYFIIIVPIVLFFILKYSILSVILNLISIMFISVDSAAVA